MALYTVIVFFSLLASLVDLAFASPSPPLVDRYQVFDDVTIFAPPSSWSNKQTSYARTVLLDQNSTTGDVLLASWSFHPPGQTYAPIYQSNDSALSWNELSKVSFLVADEPASIILHGFLYELPQDVGTYPAGTVLLTANAIPANFSSTNIQIYASLDRG